MEWGGGGSYEYVGFYWKKEGALCQEGLDPAQGFTGSLWL